MGNRSGPRTGADLEGNSQGFQCQGQISLDGSSNVIGCVPTASPLNLAGPGGNLPYTRFRGAENAIGRFGAVITQPHTATGTYIFTLDEPWAYALGGWVQLIDQGAVAALSYFVDSNVTGSTGSTSLGAYPGQNQSLPAQTIRVRFRINAGTLTDPVASTGFIIGITLYRGAPQ